MDLRLTACLAALVLAACSSATTTPTTTAPAPAATTSEDPGTTAEPEKLTAFTKKEVQALFDARCVRCHDARSATLDLSESFTETTVGVKTGGTRGTVCGRTSDFAMRIKPGDRDGSLLWHKVKGTQ